MPCALPRLALWVRWQSQGRSQWFRLRRRLRHRRARAARATVAGAGAGVRDYAVNVAFERACWASAGGNRFALVADDRGGGAGRGHVRPLLLLLTPTAPRGPLDAPPLALRLGIRHQIVAIASLMNGFE